MDAAYVLREMYIYKKLKELGPFLRAFRCSSAEWRNRGGGETKKKNQTVLYSYANTMIENVRNTFEHDWKRTKYVWTELLSIVFKLDVQCCRIFRYLWNMNHTYRQIIVVQFLGDFQEI